MAGTGLDALDIVNELRGHGVDDYISLPQFVICGQSSAKSELVKALLGIEFRREDEQDVAFVTKVRSRKLQKDQPFTARLKIKPDEDDIREPIGDTTGGCTDSTFDTWCAVLEAFKSGLHTEKPSKACRLTVQLDFEGPKLPNFDFIDLPAAFNREDESVLQLLSSQISQERTTIIAAFSDRADLTGQIIMDMLAEIDPRHDRTLYVTDGARSHLGPHVTLVRRSELLKVQGGWRIISNPQARGWRTGSYTMVQALPIAVNVWDLEDLTVSCNHFWAWKMQMALPDLLLDIQNEQENCETEMARLGTIRKTSEDQRRFLVRVQANFKSLVDEGVEGQYRNNYFEGDENRRLRSVMRKLSNDFALAMHDHRHTHHIVDLMPLRMKSLTFLDASPVRLCSWITAADYVYKIHDTILTTAQGYELPGCYSPNHIGPLFRLHSINWRALTAAYVKKAICYTERFLCDALNSSTEYSNATKIWIGIVKPSLDERKESLYAKIEELLKPFMDFEIWSRPILYQERVQQWEQKACNVMSTITKPTGRDMKALKACLELLVNMLAYYMGALEVFINNVVSLAVEGCLLRDLSGVFGLEKVLAFDPKELEKHASEGTEVQAKRARLVRRRKNLSYAHSRLEGLAQEEAFSSFNRLTADVEQLSKSPTQFAAATRNLSILE